LSEVHIDMSTSKIGFFARGLVLVWLSVLVAASASGATTPSAPNILGTRLSGANLLVSVDIPHGWEAVTLESRQHANSGAWVPRAVARTTGRVVFKLPASLNGQLLRARGEAQEPLPRSFYRGRHAFVNRKSSFWRPGTGLGEVFTLAADASVAGNVNLPVAGVAGMGSASGGSARTVEESDIWEWSGDTLYFFNQLRGLQVIEVSNPDAPVVKGTLRLPAEGEQMYLLDAQHAVLLANDNCSGGYASQLLVVDVSGAAPVTVATLPVPGWLQDSRLVGTALYIASEGYQTNGAGASDGQWGTIISSFDLSNPASARAVSSLFYPGYANAVLATDQWLFIAADSYSNDDWQPQVLAIDCSAPDGTLVEAATIPTAGDVTDKSMMNLSGNVFTAVSQGYNYTNDNEGAWMTTIETFSLASPSAPAALGSLQLTPGEELYSSSFDGNRVYIATWLQVDPLWIVDLSDPANPAIAGSVDVPGWSSYLRPMGDRLLTLGTVTNLVTLSLFDVHDPAQPALLSSVSLGENDSWSEASYDDKALTVLSDIGLVLVPYEGTTSNGWANSVQLIDLGTNSLTARGAIQHPFALRRAADHNGRVLSLSNEDLLSVDITDQDNPQVQADTSLAWPVNRVFAQGDYLLELSAATDWTGTVPPELRVASTQAPDAVLNSLGLTNLPVVGASLTDGRLYLLQSPGYFYWGWPSLLLGDGSNSDGSGTPTNFVMTVVDVTALPALAVLGQVSVAPENVTDTGGSFQAVWPAPNVLVWFGTGFDYWVNPGGPIAVPLSPVLVMDSGSGALPASPVNQTGSAQTTTTLGVSISGINGVRVVTNTVSGAAVSTPVLTHTLNQPRPNLAVAARNSARGRGAHAQLASAAHPKGITLRSQPAQLNAGAFELMPYWWPWWGNGGARLMAFDVSDPTNPQLVSSFTLDPTNTWGFSAPLTAQGLVCFSHEQSVCAPTGDWSVGDWLDVVDYSDPGNPTVRPAISIPGQLAGLSTDGAMLYLLGNAVSSAGFPLETRSAVSACSYDGVGAYLVASLNLPQSWPQPVIVNAGVVYLGRAGDTSGGSLESWTLSTQGNFVRLNALTVAQPLSALAVVNNALAAVDSDNNLTVYSLAGLLPAWSATPPSCLWLDLNRADGALPTGLWFPLDDYGVFGLGSQ